MGQKRKVDFLKKICYNKYIKKKKKTFYSRGQTAESPPCHGGDSGVSTRRECSKALYQQSTLKNITDSVVAYFGSRFR